MLTLEEMEARLLAPGAPPERWLAWKRHFERGAPPELARLARELEGLDEKRVLDVGCGHATHLLHFAPSSVGIDRLPDRVDFARSIGLRAEVRDVDTLGWNLGLGDFDLVWIANLLSKLSDPEALLASLPAVLAPKGRIVIHERVWPENPRTARWLARGVQGGCDAYDAIPERRRMTLARVAELCTKSGLEIEREWSHAVNSPALGRILHGVLVPRTLQLRPRRAAAPDATQPKTPAPVRAMPNEKKKTDAEPPHVLEPHRPDARRRAVDLERRQKLPEARARKRGAHDVGEQGERTREPRA